MTLPPAIPLLALLIAPGLDAQMAVGQEAVGQEAVGQEAVGQEAVGQETVRQETVGQEAVQFGGEEKRGVRVQGSVELTPLDAIRTAEARAIATLWERFSDQWTRNAGMHVPSERIERAVRTWLESRFDALKVVKKQPIEVRDSTVGKAYRQAYELALTGSPARSVVREGARVVRKVNKTFTQRYLAIGALWFVLLAFTLRLDRATRGYLTKRIRFAGLALAVLGAILIYP